MYLRETRRHNADGSEVGYLALAHNVRDGRTGVPKAHIIHNFGRADLVDKEAHRRLVRSISRFLDPADAVAAKVSPELPELKVLGNIRSDDGRTGDLRHGRRRPQCEARLQARRLLDDTVTRLVVAQGRWGLRP